MCLLFFFFNDTATTEIYTLSLHDALPISERRTLNVVLAPEGLRGTAFLVQDDGAASDVQWLYIPAIGRVRQLVSPEDRKSTRLNSSHSQISYAVFCLKKKKKQRNIDILAN